MRIYRFVFYDFVSWNAAKLFCYFSAIRVWTPLKLLALFNVPLQNELDCHGCWQNKNDKYLPVAGDSKNASSNPTYLHFYAQFKFVDLKLYD